MTTQEIINELTKYDRLVILEGLKGVYCRRYIDYMFNNGRKRTNLFRKTVRAYWEEKLKFEKMVAEFMNEFNDEVEELV